MPRLLTVAILAAIATAPIPAYSNDGFSDVLRAAGKVIPEVLSKQKTPTPAPREEVPVSTPKSTDKNGQSSSDGSNTCYTDAGKAFKCAAKPSGTPGMFGTEYPPTPEVPYWHTKQLCQDSKGVKKPCRIYR
jgi:hypothetical protein